MATELVINWSPGDLVQSLPVLRKLERLSDDDGTSDYGSKSYVVFYILYRISLNLCTDQTLRPLLESDGYHRLHVYNTIS
jgi:hypothetical protein